MGHFTRVSFFFFKMSVASCRKLVRGPSPFFFLSFSLSLTVSQCCGKRNGLVSSCFVRVSVCRVLPCVCVCLCETGGHAYDTRTTHVRGAPAAFRRCQWLENEQPKLTFIIPSESIQESFLFQNLYKEWRGSCCFCKRTNERKNERTNDRTYPKDVVQPKRDIHAAIRQRILKHLRILLMHSLSHLLFLPRDLFVGLPPPS